MFPFATIGRRKLLGRLFQGLAVGASVAALAPEQAKADVTPLNAADETGLVLSYVGICVADLPRSLAFYKALGFEAGEPHSFPSPLGKLLEIEGKIVNQNVFVRRNGITIELFHLDPAAKAEPGHRPVNQPGTTLLSFRVDSIDRMIELVRKNGGTVLDKTRTTMGPPGKGIDAVFCLDPDGTRLEVVGPVKA